MYYYSIDGLIRSEKLPLRALCALKILPEIDKKSKFELLIYNEFDQSLKPSDTFINFIRYSRLGRINTDVYCWDNITINDSYVVGNKIIGNYEEAVLVSMSSGNQINLLSNFNLELIGR